MQIPGSYRRTVVFAWILFSLPGARAGNEAPYTVLFNTAHRTVCPLYVFEFKTEPHFRYLAEPRQVAAFCRDPKLEQADPGYRGMEYPNLSIVALVPPGATLTIIGETHEVSRESGAAIAFLGPLAWRDQTIPVVNMEFVQTLDVAADGRPNPRILSRVALDLPAAQGGVSTVASPGDFALPYLYDVRSPSAENPSVAEIREWNMPVPLSEFRGFIGNLGVRKPLSFERARRLLDGLVAEQALVRAAYREGADRSPKIQEMMDCTHDTFVEEAFLRATLGADAPNRADFQKRVQDLVENIYRRRPLVLVPAALVPLRAAAASIRDASLKACSLGDVALEGPEYMAACEQIFAHVEDRPLAQWNGETFGLIRFLHFYASAPVSDRPDLADEQAIVRIAQQQLSERVLIDEAVAQGIDRTPSFLAELQLNRNTLVRLEVVNQFTDRASKIANRPEEAEKMVGWFREHRSELPGIDEAGVVQPLDWPRDQDEIRDLYMEYVRSELMLEETKALRAGLHLVVHNETLRKITPVRSLQTQDNKKESDRRG